MSDETPTDDAAQPPSETPAAPAPPVDETPDAPTEPEIPEAVAAPTQPEMPVAPPVAPVAAPVAAAPAPAPVASKPGTVSVPRWVLTTIAAVIAAAVMFGIGYAVGDASGNDDNDAVIGAPFGNQGDGPQQMPSFPGPGNQGNQGDQGNPGGTPQTPQSPNPSTSGAFLGVATQQTNGGLEIIQVVSGSAADDAGLEVGDVIVEFDGNPVTTPAQLANAVGNLDPGDEVEITYERDGETAETTVELGSRSTTNSN